MYNKLAIKLQLQILLKIVEEKLMFCRPVRRLCRVSCECARKCVCGLLKDVSILGYTGCHRRKGPNFGRVFLMLNYTDITQNTYIQS